MKHLRITALVCATTIIFGLASCSQVFSKLDNPADPKAADYQGYPTVASSADIKPVLPVDGGTLTGLNLTVTKVSGASAYELALATSSAELETSPIFDKSDYLSNVLDINADTISLSTTYYWKARVKDANGTWGNWSKAFSFIQSWTSTATPTFEPDGGTYATGQSVTLSCATSNSTIYYTTDGTTPTTGSTKYTGAIAVSGNGMAKTIKATAVANGFALSTVASATYTICLGAVWTARALPSSREWTVTYGNGTFVAVSAVPLTGSKVAATSPDGITWTTQSLPSVKGWRSVSYGNGTFVAVASGNQGAMAATSPNGVTWTARTLPSTNWDNWNNVSYGNGVFVAVSYNSAVAATSPDGITWTARTLPIFTWWNSITYGNGTFVAVSSTSAVAATSPDGITWTAQTLPSSSGMTSVTYGNGVFVAVADNAAAATSPDGITWTARALPRADSWSSVTYGNGVFVAVAYGSTYPSASTTALTSLDGVTWAPRTFPAGWWSSVIYGNGVFVAVSDGAVAATSP